MFTTAADMDEIYEEFGEIIETVREMVATKDGKIFRKTVPYLQVGIFEMPGADGFADFIAEFDEDFEVVRGNFGYGLFKVNDVYVALNYSCEFGMSTTISAVVFESLVEVSV
jgi:hypothetical protein